MSEQAIVATRGNGHEEYADIEEFLEATPSDDTGSEEPEQWFPKEYVELVLGHRGGGKSVRVARKLILALKHGYNVYTNYELYPEKIGIDNQPRSLDLEHLLRFDTDLNNSVIGIGEVDTWVERKRAMSTSSIMVDKFLHQLRKRGLRVLLDTQSPSLPSAIINQVDLIAWSHDSFYTDWGIEHQIRKGTSFYYKEEDHSGIFTGHPGKMWRTALGNADRIWPLYNTYQIFDPWQWARKVEIVGEKMVFNMDDQKMYTSGERNLEIEQREIKQFNTLLKAEYRAWGNEFIHLSQQNKAVLEELPNRWRVSLDKIQKIISRLTGKKRKEAERLVDKLQNLSENSNGYLARIDRGQGIIEMAKPITEGVEN